MNGKQFANYIKSKGADMVKEELRSALRKTSEEETNVAIEEAIDNGIMNTTKALLECEVSEQKITKALEKYWKLSHSEAIATMLAGKNLLISEAIRDYYRLQGYSEQKISNIFIHNKYGLILKEHPEYWSYRNEPEKLIAMYNEESTSLND